MAERSSKIAIYAALFGNLAIAVTKGVAAALTGSSAMLSEAIHSLVDTGNEALLLYGRHRANQPPDAAHPLGHGRELYFWSFVVALLIFALGGGVSFYEGVTHYLAPEPITKPAVAFIVLGMAFLFEGISFAIGYRQFLKARTSDAGFWKSFRHAKDPTIFTILFEDAAALAGILIAFAGTSLTLITGNEVFDAASSMLIGMVLAAVAVLLAREAKALLVGERADQAVTSAIQAAASKVDGVRSINAIVTMQLSPQQVIVNLNIDFDDSYGVRELEVAIAQLEEAVRASHTQVYAVFVKPQSSENFALSRERVMTPDRLANET